VVERVEAHGDPVEAGFGEGVRLAGQERPVGGQSEVVDAGDLRQHGDELFDAFAKQRLASRQSDLPDSPVDEQASDAGDLLEGEEKVPGKELVVATEDLLRHAVGAAEVATV